MSIQVKCCIVGKHEKWEEINNLLFEKANKKEIVKQYGISEKSLYTHQKEHLGIRVYSRRKDDCKICFYQEENGPIVDDLLDEGRSPLSIRDEYDFSYETIQKHRKKCRKEDIQKQSKKNSYEVDAGWVEKINAGISEAKRNEVKRWALLK